jgi:putative ABC transport system permease protein
MQQLRYAARQLGLSPGFTLVAVLTLVLGMGANSAFFSVLYGVVLRQPPYPGADRLVRVQNLSAGETANGGTLSRAELLDYRARQRVFEGLAASKWGRATLVSDGGAERVKVANVTANMFDLLRVTPARGRAFSATAEQGAAGAEAVISDEFWRVRLGGADDVLGRTVRLNGVDQTIVGILPATFSYPEPGVAAWLPLDLRSQGESDRGDHYLTVVGRLNAGVRPAQARLDLQRVARELQKDAAGAYPRDARRTIGFESLRHSQFGHMLVPLGMLAASAAFVLLIACVNVATMSLLRALARRREMAIRLSLGAGRGHIIRQLLAEAVIVCALGGIGGLIVAAWGLDALRAFAPADIPRLNEAAITVPIALFTCAVLVVVTLLVGLAPVMVATQLRGAAAAIPTTRTSDGRGASRLREAFMVMEIALAASLLVCAGLTLRSLQELLQVDLGFATEHRFSFKTNLTAGDYPDAEHVERFYHRLTTQLETMPGTISTGAISYLPLSGEGSAIAAAPDAPRAGSMEDRLTVGWGIVRGRYFETMGLALLQGRLFLPTDRAGSLPVAIVDETLARRLWSSEAAAVGQRVRLGTGSNAYLRTVIGVVRRVTHLGPGKDSLPMVYAPQSQVYQRGMYTVVRTKAPPQTVAESARAAVATADPSVPMYFAETVDERYAEVLALPRFTAGLVSAFSTLALVLAGVGIFGVTGYAVGQRTREFGIRRALGAPHAHVCRLVLGRVGRLTALGVALGIALAAALGRLMSSLLFGVEASDVRTLGAAIVIVTATALLASLAPLRHALQVNPAETLRAE